MNYRATQILVLLFAISIPGYNALAQDRVEQIDALLDKYHEYGLFNGAILVADGGKVLYKKGFGEANKEWGIENRTDTKFRIGSVTKQFTAAIILQLVEEGLIDLDASVTNYLPDYPEPQGEQMTINNLLTHTSGIPNYTSLPSFFDFTRDPYEPDSFITVFSGLDLEFEPGSKFNYSNSGYFLLGVIIEHVTGKPFDEVLDERLLDPFDLNDTGYQHHGQIIEHMAAGYNYAAGQYENAPYLDTTIPYSAGMMYSTVEDLFRWNYLLHNGAIFKDTKTLKRMTTPFLNNYGYGIGVFYVPVGEDSIMTIGHSGGIFGFSSILNYMPEEDRTVIVLDNGGGNPGAISNAVTLLLCGQPVPTPKRPIADVMGKKIEMDGIDAAIAHYHQLKKMETDEYNFGEGQLNRLGYMYLQQEKAETAIQIFRLNVEAYPDAWNPYDSLGEAYLAAGDRDQAIANYRKSLELNSENETAKATLKRLGVK